MARGFVVITDRGGHLHDALRLLEQMETVPDALITTIGPDVDYLKNEPLLKGAKILSVPQAFTWMGKKRLWNPLWFLKQLLLFVKYALVLRPEWVVSTGASNVVIFCYLAKCLGAKIVHVENLAQVVNPSITGRLLYPIATGFYVQWEELLNRYGRKAKYVGWVL